MVKVKPGSWEKLLFEPLTGSRRRYTWVRIVKPESRRLAMLQISVKYGCPYCRKQVEELDREGVLYRVYNVSRDAGARYGKIPV